MLSQSSLLECLLKGSRLDQHSAEEEYCILRDECHYGSQLLEFDGGDVDPKTVRALTKISMPLSALRLPLVDEARLQV